MGIRADRRMRRQQEEDAKKTALPGGKAVLPCGFVHNFCLECENNKTGVFDPNGGEEVRVSVCKLACRKPIYHATATKMEGHPLISSMFSVIHLPESKNEARLQRVRAGGCDVKESCLYLALMLMHGDIERIYDF